MVRGNVKVKSDGLVKELTKKNPRGAIWRFIIHQITELYWIIFGMTIIIKRVFTIFLDMITDIQLLKSKSENKSLYRTKTYIFRKNKPHKKNL